MSTEAADLDPRAQSPAIGHGPPCPLMDHRAQSPAMASFHPSRRTSPALSDSSVGHHAHTPVDPRPGLHSSGLPPRAHKPPPPPPPPRRQSRSHHLEEDIPAAPLLSDSFHSLSLATLEHGTRLPKFTGPEGFVASWERSSQRRRCRLIRSRVCRRRVTS